MRDEFKKAVAETMRLHAACWEFGNESTEADSCRDRLDGPIMYQLNDTETAHIEALSTWLNYFEDAQLHLSEVA